MTVSERLSSRTVYGFTPPTVTVLAGSPNVTPMNVNCALAPPMINAEAHASGECIFGPSLKEFYDPPKEVTF